jgi:hypothetical protein
VGGAVVVVVVGAAGAVVVVVVGAAGTVVVVVGEGARCLREAALDFVQLAVKLAVA